MIFPKNNSVVPLSCCEENGAQRHWCNVAETLFRKFFSDASVWILYDIQAFCWLRYLSSVDIIARYFCWQWRRHVGLHTCFCIKLLDVVKIQVPVGWTVSLNTAFGDIQCTTICQVTLVKKIWSPWLLYFWRCLAVGIDRSQVLTVIESVISN